MPDPLSPADSLRRLIAATGPISLQHFMGEANARYYASKDPLGSDGDFVTAPEISQMFGEMIGLWLADVWQRAGCPKTAHYAELGPGRGTLARDALRTMRRFGLDPHVHLIEGSPPLRRLAAQAAPEARLYEDLTDLPDDGPILLVANEFLDALPIRQLVRTAGGWREHMVAIRDEEFILVAGSKPMDAAVPDAQRDAPEGSVLETCPAASAVMQEVASRLACQGGAALFIDYGHAEPRLGSTLQAVRAHQKVDAFAAPGEADLTAHVDFAVLKDIAEAAGARHTGTCTQGRFLSALGIDQRAENLARAVPDEREALQIARDRLVAQDQMGDLFKVMALAAPGWPVGAGF